MGNFTQQRAFRLSSAAGLLCVVAFVLVPFIVTCVGLELDSPVSRAQATNLSRWPLGLLLCALFSTCLATRQLIVVYPPIITSRTDLSVLIFAVCTSVSLTIGVLVADCPKLPWDRITLELFG